MTDTTATKPEGYPFLRIAKSTGIPYADVLAYADTLQHDRKPHASANPVPAHLRYIIAGACDVQCAVRDGYIDWQTGERLK